MTPNDVQTKINYAKALDFGTIFNNCIELFKKTWLQGFIIILLSMLLSLPFAIVVYIPMIILGISSEVMEENNFMIFGSLIGLVFLVLVIVMLLGIITVSLGLKTAFYRIAKQKDFNESGSDDYFFFLRKPYLKKTFTFSLAYFGISFAAALLCYLPLIYAIVPLSLMLPIYAFNPDFSISDIVRLGFNLGNKKWLITFGLMIVTGIITIALGFLLCGIGIYFLISLGYLVQYFIYKDVVGFENTTVEGINFLEAGDEEEY